jgi:hypothetical protein
MIKLFPNQKHDEQLFNIENFRNELNNKNENSQATFQNSSI